MGRRSVAGMLKFERSIVAMLARRFRSRAVVDLENLAVRHQLHVLRRQRPGRPRLFAIDRLLWVLLYRLWPTSQTGWRSGPDSNLRFLSLTALRRVSQHPDESTWRWLAAGDSKI
jgi:hypothetical protein